MRCHIQGQGFGNKLYFSEFFTVVCYLKTAEELIVPSVFFQNSVDDFDIAHKTCLILVWVYFPNKSMYPVGVCLCCVCA